MQDACNLVNKIIFSKKKLNNHEIFNVCSNKPISLTHIIKKVNDITVKKPILNKRKLQDADVIKTHGSNIKILKTFRKAKFYLY